MFGLPLARTKTKKRADRPICDSTGITDPNELTRIAYGCCVTCPKVIKSALRLAEMKWNHYTMLISQDWKNLRSWGGRSSYGNTGPGGDTNSPETVAIGWAGPKEEIIYLRSVGYNMYSMFRTSDNNVYGTGQGVVLNGHSGDTWARILTNVIFIYIGGGQNSASSIYVKTNGKVYGLGVARTSGFGSITSALTTDDGSDSNYLGIDNAVKAWLQYYGDDVNTTKSFVLKNDGTLWACGYNASGALGVNSTSTHVTTWTQVVDSSGNPLTNVTEVITSTDGGNASYFLANGSVYVAGINDNGRLGIGALAGTTKIWAEKISHISNARLMCSSNYNQSLLVTTSDNKIYTWGLNSFGECGVGNTSFVNYATDIGFPVDQKVTWIHGGGMYGQMYGAFVVVTENGRLYVCGSNQTYALGVPAQNGNNITTFTRNDYFGYGAASLVEPWRFPIDITSNNYVAGDTVITSNVPIDYRDKSVTPTGLPTRTERVYVNPGYYVTGPGIQPETSVTIVDRINHKIYLDKPVTAGATNAVLTYTFYPKAYQADLCGYPGEMSMKAVSEDGTLYQCGWNQLVGGYWNFNPRVGTQTVDIPTAFEADFV